MDALLEQPLTARVMPGRGATVLGSSARANWARIQRVNLARHAFGLAPFKAEDFGNGHARPSQAHLGAVNALLDRFGQRIRLNLGALGDTRRSHSGSSASVAAFAVLKDRGQRLVEAAELVWDFYYKLFGQRQSTLSGRLHAADRIALDCYQTVYTGLGRARSIPTPPPFSFMAAGLGPATYRRGIPVPQLGRLANPFPLIQLPHHRLLNPWTLGAIPHEVGHNLQSDLGLWEALPRTIEHRVRQACVPAAVARTWRRWHSELFSDLIGILFVGPAMASSLLGVLSRSPANVVRFKPADPHPPSILRMHVSLTLLSRLGFRAEADAMSRLWGAVYPRHLRRHLPRALTRTFAPAAEAAIDAIVYTAYPHLGNKRLVDVVRFDSKEQDMTREAAGRLAAGIDPGIVPERFLIGASRIALERRLSPPGRIASNFYTALGRR